jgi:hypothetical protein
MCQKNLFCADVPSLCNFGRGGGPSDGMVFSLGKFQASAKSIASGVTGYPMPSLLGQSRFRENPLHSIYDFSSAL